MAVNLGSGGDWFTANGPAAPQQFAPTYDQYLAGDTGTPPQTGPSPREVNPDTRQNPDATPSTDPVVPTPPPTTTPAQGDPPSDRTTDTFGQWLQAFYTANGLSGQGPNGTVSQSDISYWQNVDPTGISQGNYGYLASKLVPNGSPVMPDATTMGNGPGPRGAAGGPALQSHSGPNEWSQADPGGGTTGPNGSNPPATGGGSGGNGSFSYPAWTGQFSYAPWTQTFTPPTGLTEQNDPGYQERLNLADQNLNANAAASGTGLSTGTLKDLASYNQTFASQEYGNVYGRALTDYQTALQAYQQNYTTAAQQYGQSYQQYLNGYQQAAGSYGLNFNVSNTLNQEAFGNNLSLASLGLSGATGTNTAAAQYATNATGSITGAGNAAAATTVGGANALTAGLSSAVNNGVLPALYGSQPNPYAIGQQSSYTPYVQPGYGSSGYTGTGTPGNPYVQNGYPNQSAYYLQ